MAEQSSSLSVAFGSPLDETWHLELPFVEGETFWIRAVPLAPIVKTVRGFITLNPGNTETNYTDNSTLLKIP